MGFLQKKKRCGGGNTEASEDVLERCHGCNEAGSTRPRCGVMVQTPGHVHGGRVVLSGTQIQFSNASDYRSLLVIILPFG